MRIEIGKLMLTLAARECSFPLQVLFTNKSNNELDKGYTCIIHVYAITVNNASVEQ